jgi:hypothetical protein
MVSILLELKMINEILVGSGNYIVSGISKDNKEGVGIFSYPNHGMAIDSCAPIPETDNLICAILFENMDGARLFQDQVNAAIMYMNGYTVENK